jgi:hypothetical protein
MNHIDLLQLFARSLVSNDDLGYLTQWCFKHNDLDLFIKAIEEGISNSFFDHNNRVQQTLDRFLKVFEADLNAFESESFEG